LSFWDKIRIMDLIKLTGSVSVSRSLFRLPPGTTALCLQIPGCFQVICSPASRMAASRGSDGERVAEI